MANGEKQPTLKGSDLDVSGVSLKNLEAGLWWVKNRGKLKKLVIAVLLVFCIGTMGYSLFGFGYYFFKGMYDDQKLATDLVNTTTVSPDFLAERAAQDLGISIVGILDNDSSYDLYVNISNRNPKHWGTFSYCFTAGDDENLKCGEGFVLPNEKKIVMGLGVKSAVRPSNIKFSLNNMAWKKINPHEIPDWEKYKNDRLQIDIRNTSFKPAATSELSEKLNLNTLSFTANNTSAYGFWEAPLSIILYRSNQIVGINQYLLKEFSSYDAQEVNLTWPGDLNGVNDIDISPEINIMDEGNYLEPGR